MANSILQVEGASKQFSRRRASVPRNYRSVRQYNLRHVPQRNREPNYEGGCCTYPCHENRKGEG